MKFLAATVFLLLEFFFFALICSGGFRWGPEGTASGHLIHICKKALQKRKCQILHRNNQGHCSHMNLLPHRDQLLEKRNACAFCQMKHILFGLQHEVPYHTVSSEWNLTVSVKTNYFKGKLRKYNI